MQCKPGHNAASFLLWNTPPSTVISAYAAKQTGSITTKLFHLLDITQTQSMNTQPFHAHFARIQIKQKYSSEGRERGRKR